jgi:hypothetical protein
MLEKAPWTSLPKLLRFYLWCCQQARGWLGAEGMGNAAQVPTKIGNNLHDLETEVSIHFGDIGRLSLNVPGPRSVGDCVACQIQILQHISFPSSHLSRNSFLGNATILIRTRACGWPWRNFSTALFYLRAPDQHMCSKQSKHHQDRRNCKSHRSTAWLQIQMCEAAYGIQLEGKW